MTEGLSRRHAIGAATMVGVGVPVLAACGSSDSPGTAVDPETPTSPTTGASSPSDALTTKADIPVGGGVIFPNDGVVVTQPEAGTFHGFTIICTHQGCTVTSVSSTINCPCHGSKYSIEDGSVVSGPAPAPLTVVDLTVKGDDISKA
jgi:Rieske Fe-S protein